MAASFLPKSHSCQSSPVPVGSAVIDDAWCCWDGICWFVVVASNCCEREDPPWPQESLRMMGEIFLAVTFSEDVAKRVMELEVFGTPWEARTMKGVHV